MTTLLLTGSSSSFYSPLSGNTSSGYAAASVSSYGSYKSNRPPAAKGLMKEVNLPQSSIY
ncbi:MAG TPA: hypothetical protein VE818_13455 [Nitrososphaeraceae archaeon]|jgi:hypothetical protein|nr:hypothetical protein [Nitrososphaeraceae archaeon]